MDVFEAIHGRRSIRKFRPDPIPSELLHRILDAAHWAPSAGNLQSWEFVIVQDQQKKQEVAKAALGQSFITQAPVVIVVCADTQRSSIKYGERGKVLYSLQESAAAAQNIILAAYALGLGTCWVGAFFEEALSESLSLPSGVVPVSIIPIGYPAQKSSAPRRAELTDIVHFETYGNKRVMMPGTPPVEAQEKIRKKRDIGLIDIFK